MKMPRAFSRKRERSFGRKLAADVSAVGIVADVASKQERVTVYCKNNLVSSHLGAMRKAAYSAEEVHNLASRR